MDDKDSRLLTVAAALVLCEAIALAGLGVYALIEIHSDRVAVGLTNAIFFLLAAAGLAFCAWGIRAERRWSRSPIVMTQIIQLGVAWSFYGNETVWVAVVLAALAVVVLALMLAPSTTQRLYGDVLDADPADEREDSGTGSER